MIEAIIKRGYALDEEMEQLCNAPEHAQTRRMFWTEDGVEHFHGIVLDATRFVLANQILMRGPRTLIGMVGVYFVRGGVAMMSSQASIDLWTATGQPAIDYANRHKINQR
jgi:hypothetical protein